MKASDLDNTFDTGEEDILDAFDIEKSKRPNIEQKRVNVDFPSWMVAAMDKESKRLGVTRQSLIKMWLAERLDS